MMSTKSAFILEGGSSGKTEASVCCRARIDRTRYSARCSECGWIVDPNSGLPIAWRSA